MLTYYTPEWFLSWFAQRLNIFSFKVWMIDFLRMEVKVLYMDFKNGVKCCPSNLEF